MKTSIFNYDCAKYSVLDIIEFIKIQNYDVSYDNEMFIVNKMGISIYLPNIKDLENNNKEVWKRTGVPAISWKPINDLYSQRNRALESGNTEAISIAEQAYKEWHKKAKKLYTQLKDKFGIKGIKTLRDVEEAIKKGEYPMSIKDSDYIESLRNGDNKKPWQFWKK